MIGWVENRLVRWGQWLASDRGQTSGGRATLRPIPRGNFRGAIVPTMDLEASRTHDWALTCSKDDQRMLIDMYAREQSVTVISIRYDLSRTTVYSRLRTLHQSLALYLEQRRAK